MNFADLFPNAESSAIDLLKRMLTFGRDRGERWSADPSKRITVQEALQSDFVSLVRRPEYEVEPKRTLPV